MAASSMLECLLLCSGTDTVSLYLCYVFTFLRYANTIYFCLFDGKQIAAPETCPAKDVGNCGDSDDWEGEFFPDIPKIKYEVDLFLTIFF